MHITTVKVGSINYHLKTYSLTQKTLTIMKKAITSMMALLAIMLMTASCGNDNDIAKAIPADAPVVFKANVKSLSEKAALKDNKQLQADLQKGMEGMSEALKKKMKAVMDDPKESGFALQKPVFIAVTDPDKSQFVISLGVNDKDKVTELFKSTKDDCKTMKITEGEDQTVVEDQGMQVAYNSDLCVITVERTDAATLLKQDDDKSILSQDKYAKMLEGTNDIDAYIDYAALTKTASKFSKQAANAAIDKLTEGMYIIANVNFEEKEAVINTEFFGNKEFLKLCEEIENKPSGDYLKLAPADAYVVAQCGVKDFDKIKEILPKAETEQIDQQLKAMGLSIDQILKAIEGDILISVAPNGSQPMPQISFALACKDQKVWEAITKTAEPMGQGMLEKKDANSYTAKVQALAGMDYTISYDGKAIVITPVTAPAKNFNDNENAKVVKDGGFFIDMQQIMSNQQVKGMAGKDGEKLADIQSISGTSGGTKGQYKVTFNKPGNALATIIKMTQK